ncbi:RNA polymerase factor sigma-54 [Microvirga massiliensis]|uniref:RNA polymerase factor sigma-54 n=1 Tax=Microvirga massiliensis TaxID=1033741 RepID=UPI00062BC48F|nr:RNA polymerase factor sigma-54 [Microvirga massiliensis]
MGLLQRLEMRQGQSLVMTPQLLQAIKLLQLSHIELVAYVETELERNPLLERPETEAAQDGGSDIWSGDDAQQGIDGEGDGAPEENWLKADIDPSRDALERDMDTSFENVFQDEGPTAPRQADDTDVLPILPSFWSGAGSASDEDLPGFEATLSRDITLGEHLQSQLELAFRDPKSLLIGRHLVDAVDEAGYLAEPVDAIADRLGAPLVDVQSVLAVIHTFDPPGIGARSLTECLAIQLRERDRLDPAMAALLERLDLVARRDMAALRRVCGVDDEDLTEMLAEIRQLEPKPGRAFGSGPVGVLVPDVTVHPRPDGTWQIELNPDTLPRVLVNQTYYARVTRTARNETEKSFLTECLQNANWLTRSLEQRARTILKVAAEIVRQQEGFFRHGVAFLRPLNLKTVADEIGMHESTVSRVTSNKAIGTSRGTFEMKYFFTAAIAGAGGIEAHSSEAVRHRLKQLIDAENPREVLSDDALVQRLKEEGIDIARRTVAKYRESLRIPSSVERRRVKQAL